MTLFRRIKRGFAFFRGYDPVVIRVDDDKLDSSGSNVYACNQHE